MYINSQGHLIARYYQEEGGELAQVDLGLVVPQFTATATTLNAGESATASAVNNEGQVSLSIGIPRGANGTNGTDGADGAPGKDGISPTFSISSNGHLMADYDNPYVPD